MDNVRFRLMTIQMLKSFAESSRPGYLSELNTFAKFLGGKSLFNATAADAIEYLSHLHDRLIDGEPLANKTIKCKIHYLYSIYDSALDFGLTENPFERAARRARSLKRQYKREPKTVDFKEVLSTIACINSLRDRALMAILFGGGLRVTEAVSLKFSDISIIEDHVGLSVLTGKTRKRRPVMMPLWASRFVIEYIKTEVNSEYIFPSRIGSGSRPLTRKQASNLCHGYFGLRAHSARHTHISYLLSKGVPLPDIARAVGHEHISSTMIYDQRARNFESCASRKADFSEVELLSEKIH